MLAAVSSAGCLPHVLLPQPDADDEVEELRELNEAQTPTGVAAAPELELEGGAVAAEDGAWDHTTLLADQPLGSSDDVVVVDVDDLQPADLEALCQPPVTQQAYSQHPPEPQQQLSCADTHECCTPVTSSPIDVDTTIDVDTIDMAAEPEAGEPVVQHSALLPADGGAAMTTKEHSNELIVYKSKSSTGDVGGREAGANGAYITLPLGADPTRARLCLRHADGVLLSCDIQLIESMEHRQKHVQFLGMSAEMWPEIVNGERTDRYEMFFTVHSTSSKIKETDRWLDSRRQPTTLKEETHYELCTCGRPFCQALKLSELRCVPGALELSTIGKVKQTEMRVCEHRIKSRLTNSIQGRNTKADARTDKPFWLSVELEVGSKSQSLPILCHDGSGEVARFRVAAKPDEQQHRCSARSCSKKKDSLRLGQAQLLVAMSKLGYMDGVDEAEPSKRLKRAYGQLRKLCGSSAVPHPAVLMEKFKEEHAAGALRWVQQGCKSKPSGTSKKPAVKKSIRKTVQRPPRRAPAQRPKRQRVLQAEPKTGYSTPTSQPTIAAPSSPVFSSSSDDEELTSLTAPMLLDELPYDAAVVAEARSLTPLLP